MKLAKKVLVMVLALTLVLTLPVMASAKTSSSPIDAPPGSTAVFSVQAGDLSADFTWDEISGTGAYESFTRTYAAKVNGEPTTQDWTGVKLADLLDAAEKEMGVKFSYDYQVSAIAADGFTSVFTVADVQNAANNYLVAADPCSNYDEGKTYPNSYTRILREASEANQANTRCVLGVKVLDAEGNELNLSSGKSKTQGGDVANAVFYIAVKESAEAPLKFYYYTAADLNAFDDTHDFKYVDHSVPKTVTGRGASLANLINDISDATITGDMIVQYAESDGYHADADTPIEDSAYKDKVSWLTGTHTGSGGDTAEAVNTMICLTSWTKYDNPDENNVDSTEWEDADMNSGYLRAYRQRPDANSAVIKTLMGAVISPSGDVFTGDDGYTLSAKSTNGQEMRIIEPSTGIAYNSQKVTGLVPGMQYAVKAPEITGATVSGPDTQTITAAEGTSTKAVFTYRENTWLTVIDQPYTLSAFEALSSFTQTPTAEEVSAHGTPYGYYDAMYYRYTGVWLKDLVNGSAVLKAADGSTVTVPAADTGKYFIVSGYTASKSSTNVSEGKRYTYALAQPQVIIPGDGTLVGEAEAAAEGNKKVTVAVEELQSIQNGSGGSGSGGNGGSGGGGGTVTPTAKYTVSATTDGKGTVTGAGEYNQGSSVTLKATPEENYEFTGWYDGDQLVSPNAEYTFTVSKDVTFAAKFTEKATDNPPDETWKNPFTDVKDSDYFFDPVKWAVQNDITNGTSPATFSPDDNCTRAQMVTFLWRAKGCPEPAAVNNPFTDVKADAYYYKAVLWAAEKGITTGTGKTTFSPDDTVSRAQSVTFLWRTEGSESVASDNPFTDVDANAYYAKAVDWAVKNGVTTGKTATSFAPEDPCTRAQIVTFLYRENKA